MRSFLLYLAIMLCTVAPVTAQTPTAEQQVEAATGPAPEALRADATVKGYDAAGQLTTLREGTGDLVCLADDPSDDRFHVACYHASLEPFMQRGRTLKAEGMDRNEVDRVRRSEIEAGTLSMPEQAAALYSLSGPADSYDPEAGEITGASPLYVVYVPFATAESTGLPTRAPAGQPWLMEPGTPWAHIMIVPPRE